MARLCVITGSSESSRTRGRRSTVAWEAHRHREEKEQNTYTRLVAEARAWRGSARTTIAAAKPREVTGVTPTNTNTTTAARHGDDGTGTASSTCARSVSGGTHVNDEDESSSETTNRPRRFSSGFREEAIRQERR
jgi:hypothetical protein